MLLVNPHSAFRWTEPLDISGVPMMGVPEKQGWAFSRAGWKAYIQRITHEPDEFGKLIRQSQRPQSRPTLLQARKEYATRTVVPMPRYFIIEPTAFCNKACPFCSIHVIQRFSETGKIGNTMMRWADFSKLMLEIESAGGAYGLSLYQLGEPMLWRGRDEAGQAVDIGDMIMMAKEAFEVVNVSTNGDVDNLSYLLREGVELDDLIISIDGLTSDVYLANRPSTKSGDVLPFERTIDRVLDFLHAKVHAADQGRKVPYVRMQIINKQDTAPQILSFIKFWIMLPGVDDVFVKNLDAMTPWLGDDVVKAEEAHEKMAAIATMPCQHLWAVGSMTASGTFNACCHDARTELTDPSFACNIRNQTFESWWSGPFMTQLRAEHKSGTFRSPCATCHERDPWLG